MDGCPSRFWSLQTSNPCVIGYLKDSLHEPLRFTGSVPRFVSHRCSYHFWRSPFRSPRLTTSRYVASDEEVVTDGVVEYDMYPFRD